MSQPETNIQLNEQPRATGPTDIPELLTRYLESRNLRPSWQWNDHRVLGGMYAHHMEPFNPEHFRRDEPDDYEAVFSGRAGVKRLWINAEGHVQSWDGILMVQPVDIWEAEQRAELERRQKMEGELKGPQGEELDPEALAAAMNVLGIPTRDISQPRSLAQILAGPPGEPLGGLKPSE